MRRASTAALAAATVAVGLVGVYSYWENYYVDRGFAAPHRLHGARPGRLFKVRFYSHALRRQADYMVYLPAGYGAARRLPVFYLLHGIPGRPISYSVIGHIEVRLDNLISRRLAPPMILAFPDGRIGSSTFSDSEWANTPSGRFDSYVVDVVHDVDARFAAATQRTLRVIGGLSAGGYGALNVALHHLGVFANAEVWSGYFTQSATGVFAHANPTELAGNSPLAYARALHAVLHRFPLRVFMYAGRADHNSARQLSEMAHVLRRAGADVSATAYPGGHDWELWNGHLDQMLILAGRDVARPLHRAPLLPHRLGREAGNRLGPLRRDSAFVPTAIGVQGSASVPGAGGEAAGLLGGLLLAIVSAAAINLGFLLQHRGLSRIARHAGLRAMIRGALRRPGWLGGQALGWAGFAGQIVAVSLAPLALVQAFAAGGLALSVPLAAGLFGYEISRRQRNAVLAVAVALATLPIAMSTRADRLGAGTLLALIAVGAALAAAMALGRRPAARALAAGLLYGVADAAIKAISVNWGPHGAGALLSGWTAIAALATFGGFLAFQTALRDGSAITAISLSTAACALAALGFGLLAFGESLGRGPAAVVVHVGAIAVVLGCAPLLAAAQSEIGSAASDQRLRSGPEAVRVALATGTGAHQRTAEGE